MTDKLQGVVGVFVNYRQSKSVVHHKHAILKFPGFADSFRMTISTGITTYQPVESIDELIARSDSAMYKAKSMGRNRVVIEHLEE